MRVFFGNLTKRNNSTKRPATAGFTELNCKCKGIVSIEAPRLEVVHSSFNYTYAYVPEWGHYYFVTDVSIAPGQIYTVQLVEDPLATYRTEIMAYECMVERSASDYDEFIEDTEISQSYENLSFTRSSGNMTLLNGAGCYILKTAGKGDGSSVGVNAYAVDADQIADLLDWAFLESSWGDWLTNFVGKILFNPFKYIVSLMWVPFASTQLGNTDVNIKMGNFTSTARGKLVTAQTLTEDIHIAAPSSQYNDFRKYSPAWTRIEAKLPGIGLMNFNPAEFGDGIDVRYLIDCVSFQCNAYITTSVGTSHPMVTVASGTLGVPVQIGTIQLDANSLASSAIGTAAGVLTKRYEKAAQNAASGVLNLTSPTMMINGTPGNKTDLRTIRWIECTRIEQTSKDIPVDTMGRPLFEVKTLGDLSGFCKCSGASIPLDCLESERDAVNAALNTGIYLE